METPLNPTQPNPPTTHTLMLYAPFLTSSNNENQHQKSILSWLFTVTYLFTKSTSVKQKDDQLRTCYYIYVATDQIQQTH